MCPIREDGYILAQPNFVSDVFSKKDLRRHYVARIIRTMIVSVRLKRPIVSDTDVSSESIEEAVA